jgi:hypothetical protein
MTKEERNKLWDLYSITNKMGGACDYTAINPIALIKYKAALTKVSIVISLIINRSDEEKCQRYIDELDALSRWNFGDRNGNISEEEKRVNERIKQKMGGWTPFNY